jgi:hypothetical protein
MRTWSIEVAVRFASDGTEHCGYLWLGIKPVSAMFIYLPFRCDFVVLGIAFGLVANVSPLRAEDELDVGRTASGQLKIQPGFTPPLVLPVSIFPGISGYATGAVGFHSVFFDDAANDFFQLSTDADFRLILVAKDPGIEIWNDHGSGYMAVGDSFYVGPAPFDTHPIWNIVSGTPSHSYAITLKFHDLTGIYPDSTPFAVSFTPVQIYYPVTITGSDTLHATLSWPTNAAGWELQNTAGLTATNWQTITNLPVVSGTNFSLDVVMTNAQQFFRLHQP